MTWTLVACSVRQHSPPWELALRSSLFFPKSSLSEQVPLAKLYPPKDARLPISSTPSIPSSMSEVLFGSIVFASDQVKMRSL